ncbi:MAG: hypothetical protein ACI9OJ_002173, partial [Myxococcota bacterium]
MGSIGWKASILTAAAALLVVGCPDETTDSSESPDTTADTSGPDVSNIECTEAVDCVDGGLSPGTCQELACSPAGRCQIRASVDGTACEDGDLCTETDTCDKGSCAAGGPTDCDDSIACTSESCQSESGCVYEPDHTQCADGVLCTSDVCDLTDGCTNPTDPLACDDGIACSEDVCNDDGTCSSTLDDSRCEDGVECTVDVCTSTIGCSQTIDDTGCDDQVACTIDLCDPVGGCQNDPDPTACDDLDACTSDVCDPVGGCINEQSGCGNAFCDCGETKESCPVDCPADAPTVDLNGAEEGADVTVTVTEGDPAIVLAPDVVVTDTDEEAIESASLVLADPFDGADEILAVEVGASGLVADFSNNELTLTGSATPAVYAGVLASVTYVNQDDNPSENSRSINITVTDSDGLNSNIAVVDLTVFPVEDPPEVTLAQAQFGFVEAAEPVAVTGGLEVTDPEGVLASMTFALTGHLDGADEVLAVTDDGSGLSIDYADSVLTISGLATIAVYQALAETLTYDHAGAPPTPGERTVTIVADDGVLQSTPVELVIVVAANNVTPELDLDTAADGVDTASSWTEGSGASAMLPNVAVSDDDSMIGSATLTLTDAAASEVLDVTASDGV